MSRPTITAAMVNEVAEEMADGLNEGEAGTSTARRKSAKGRGRTGRTRRPAATAARSSVSHQSGGEQTDLLHRIEALEEITARQDRVFQQILKLLPRRGERRMSAGGVAMAPWGTPAVVLGLVSVIFGRFSVILGLDPRIGRSGRRARLLNSLARRVILGASPRMTGQGEHRPANVIPGRPRVVPGRPRVIPGGPRAVLGRPRVILGPDPRIGRSRRRARFLNSLARRVILGASPRMTGQGEHRPANVIPGRPRVVLGRPRVILGRFSVILGLDPRIGRSRRRARLLNSLARRVILGSSPRMRSAPPANVIPAPRPVILGLDPGTKRRPGIPCVDPRGKPEDDEKRRNFGGFVDGWPPPDRHRSPCLTRHGRPPDHRTTPILFSASSSPHPTTPRTRA